MVHDDRIREAMKAGKLPPMGGAYVTVEIDETFIGKKAGEPVSSRSSIVVTTIA